MSAQLSSPQMPFNFDDDLSIALPVIAEYRSTLNNADYLKTARSIARMICRVRGTVTADDVRRETERMGIAPKSSVAYGALFKSPEWEFTGDWMQSSYITNHSRAIRKWRLKESRAA